MGRDYLGGAGGPSASASGASGAGPSEPLLAGVGAAVAFSASPASVVAPRSSRRPKDTFWAVLYLATLAAALAGGVYAVVHHNPEGFAHGLNPKYLADPAHCPVAPSGGGGGRSLLALSGDADQQHPAFSPKFFLAAASFYVALSVAGGVLLGVGAMALYRTKPRAAVYGAIALQVGLPLGGALAILASGAPFAAATPFLFTAFILAFVYYLYREQLGLVAQLLGTAAQAISHVYGTIVAAAGLQLASALVSLPLAASALFAYANGDVARSALVAKVVEAGGESAQCFSASGDPVLCCAWQPKGWAIGVAALCALSLAWTSLLAFCLKTYVVSGAVATWYFAPVDAGAAATSHATSDALKNALGPSFGTLALAAWILNLISWARQALQQLREQSRESFIAQLLLSCVDFLYSVLEQLSKFGVVFAAITGDDFFTAARQATSLLSRNLLSTAAVFYFPGTMVGLTNLVLSAAWSAAAGLTSYHLAFAPAAARAIAEGATDVGPVAAQSAIAVGVVAFLFAYVALAFLASVLLSAVDAAYLCFAIDRDRHLVTREEVHAVMLLLPAAKGAASGGPGGGIVEHPGGGYAFGAERGAAAV